MDELVKRLRAHNGWALNETLDEAADAIEELIAALTASNTVIANSKPHWISVEERLPKYGERVLVFGGFTMYVAYYDKNRYGGESWHKLNSKSHYCNPTHWMPLPEPPKEET